MFLPEVHTIFLSFVRLGITVEANRRYASYDGDADRIIFFTAKEDGSFVMLDGDKIAALIASYLKDLLSKVLFLIYNSIEVQFSL